MRSMRQRGVRPDDAAAMRVVSAGMPTRCRERSPRRARRPTGSARSHHQHSHHHGGSQHRSGYQREEHPADAHMRGHRATRRRHGGHKGLDRIGHELGRLTCPDVRQRVVPARVRSQRPPHRRWSGWHCVRHVRRAVPRRARAATGVHDNARVQRGPRSDARSRQRSRASLHDSVAEVECGSDKRRRSVRIRCS